MAYLPDIFMIPRFNSLAKPFSVLTDEPDKLFKNTYGQLPVSHDTVKKIVVVENMQGVV